MADGVTTFHRRLRRSVVWILGGLLALTLVAAAGCGSGSGSEGNTDATATDSVTTAQTTGEASVNSNNPRVELVTSLGTIVLELDSAAAPITTENFVSYVEAGFYDGTIFHRVMPGFMAQGGGFTPDMKQKATNAPIKNEAGNGLKNLRGTVAMARTGVVDSATAQFFINLVDNSFLDHTANTPQGFGYAVFGKVVSGMDVVDAIAAVPTATVGQFQDVPQTPVVIESAKILADE